MTCTTRPAAAAQPGLAPLARRSAAIVIACAAAFLGGYALAVHTALGQRLDDSLMLLALSLPPALSEWSDAALVHYHQATFGLVAAALLLVGLVTRGPAAP